MRLLVLSCFVSLIFATELGDRLLNGFGVYNPLPITTAHAIANKWKPISDVCDPSLGIKYAINGELTTKNPIALYFTPAGQVAGAGVKVFGALKTELVDAGYFQKLDTKEYFISVAFRSKKDVCSSSNSSLLLGDQAVINADTLAQALPLTEEAAQRENWHKGACFAGMGHHYFYDLVSAPNMSWRSSNLLPITVMYNNHGDLQSIFFTSTIRQQTIRPPSTNWWEPVPLPTVLMCKNWCDSDCGFSDYGAFDVFSTMHLYFRDTSIATCDGGCTIGCCP